MTAATYDEFLRAKVDFEQTYGFGVEPADISDVLLPHQKQAVAWALAGGRRALFESFGLGKTVQQLELLRLIGQHHGGRRLVVCPLGVRQEFTADADRLLDLELRFVRRTDQVGGPGLYLTNYESVRDGRLDPRLFDAVSLDEAACLRNFGTVTSQTFSTAFAHCAYRFVATATPAPNEYREIFEYAHFLGVMDRGQCMTRFTKRDSTKANNLTLLANMEDEFWHWVASWALFLTSPAEICTCGCHQADETSCAVCPCGRYRLPEMTVAWHELATPPGTYASPDRDGQGRLVRDSSLGVVDAAREKRDTLTARVAKLADLIDAYTAGGGLDSLIVWVELNAEQTAVERLCRDKGLSVSSIYGTLDLDEQEARLQAWRTGQTAVLVAKPVMLGEGVNLQRCNKAVFLGVTFKFADTFQAIHRVHRFGQGRPVEIHFVHAESERTVVGVLQRKWAQHDTTAERMAELVADHGLSHRSLTEALTRTIGVERVEAAGARWMLALNDTVSEAALIGDSQVGLVVTSIPFGTLYEYSTAVEDFGHTETPDHFWAQMDYLTPHLLRILAPGRIYCCHVKDRIVFGNVTGAGYSTVYPFHADAIRHTVNHGFDYLGMITVVTDVVRENNQSYRLGWSEQCRDGTRMGVGTPEYVLIFRKPQSDRTRGYADIPVAKDKADYSRSRWQVDAHGFWRDPGNRYLTPEDFDDLPTGVRSKLFEEWSAANVYDHELHVAIGERIDAKGQLPATFMCLAPASPAPDVWHDILRIHTLNSEQARRGLDQHVCPLPFGIADRLIRRYSNPDDLVYDPFCGIGTVPLRALHAGRRGRGVELHPGYFADSVRYLRAEEARADIPTLFDLIETETAR